MTIDGTELPVTQFSGLNAGAFDISLGGVFRIFPLAREAGALHFQVGDIRPWEVIRSLPSLARGGLIRSNRLTEVDGSELTIEALGDESLSPIIDGESFPGVRQMTVRSGTPVRIATLPGRPRRSGGASGPGEGRGAGVRAAVAAAMSVVGFDGGAHCTPNTRGRLEEAGTGRVISDLGELARLL